MVLTNDFARQWRCVRTSVHEAVEQVGESGRLILGEEVELLEKKLAQYCKRAHCIGVANGMEALEISLRAAGVTPTDKVLTTPLSAFATTLAVMRVGALPVFADVDRRGLIRLEQCRQLLTRDPSIQYLLPVHLYGFGLARTELQALSEDFKVTVIEDCAQSIGGVVDGCQTGSVGKLAATSFYPTKNLGAMGDGGAIVTDDEALQRHCRCLRNYGQTESYVHMEFGQNSRLDELQAAILHRAMLPRLPEWLQRRAEIAFRYLRQIDNPALDLVRPESGERPAWHLFPLLVKRGKRQAFRDYLETRAVKTGVHYPKLIPAQEALKKHRRFECPVELANATRFAEAEVSLPIHPFLTDDEVQSVIDACNQWTP